MFQKSRHRGLRQITEIVEHQKIKTRIQRHPCAIREGSGILSPLVTVVVWAPPTQVCFVSPQRGSYFIAKVIKSSLIFPPSLITVPLGSLLHHKRKYLYSLSATLCARSFCDAPMEKEYD